MTRLRPQIRIDAMSSIEIEPAPACEARSILRQCLAGSGANTVELERRVNVFLEYAREMSFDLSRQWWCRSQGRTLSACSCIESPGRTAMLLLPEGVEAETQRRLIEHVFAEESQRDVRLLQALIDVNDDCNRHALQRCGFREIAVLLYLELKLADARTVSPPAKHDRGKMEMICYEAAMHSEFAELIKATYIDSMDCPGLSALRDIDDVIAGHKGAGRFSPQRWLLLKCEKKSAGCILLSENPIRPVLEIVYMGIHPDFRRQSLGHRILDHAIHLGHRDGFQAITLAVDSRNHVADRLYRSTGFRQTHRRRALIRPLDLTSNEA